MSASTKAAYGSHFAERYRIEPFIKEFLVGEDLLGKKVLEIGVGLGADHQLMFEAGAKLKGIDLTARAVEHTRRRMALFDYPCEVACGDAEKLCFENDSFDVVVSWGVIHHSPDIGACISEIRRVLKPGGVALIMIYHRYSFVGLMLWFRYGLCKLKPFSNLDSIYSKYLESPGTKAFSVDQAEDLFKSFDDLQISTKLCQGDLLTDGAGQRHDGYMIKIARMVWPRTVIKKYFASFGLYMLIRAVK